MDLKVKINYRLCNNKADANNEDEEGGHVLEVFL